MGRSEKRPLIRASDIGLWAYCERAWWLARVQNAPHRYPKRLTHGTTVHEAHGQTLARAQRYQRWAQQLLGLGLLLLGLALFIWLLRN